MSIDREINARVDAYGSNPQALQKKYSMSKDLVDLLALQKIKKSMDEERNSIAMMMNTNPATIKQQREQEVFGRTAQDVAQQLGGILQTAKNKKQMAQRRPASQGLGALMPQQGKRPQQPQRMQAGGIVAFNDGNDVETKRKIQELINLGYSDEQIAEFLSRTPEELIKSVRRQQKEDMQVSGEGVSAEKGQNIPYGREFDTVSRLPKATDPAGPMEEVVVTGQREPDPLSAEGMMREQAKTKQTKDKNIAEIPAPQDITPAKPTAKKGAPQFTEVDGVRRQVNPDGSLVVMPAADTAPSMLEYMRQGSLDKIKEKYLAGTPLSQNEIKMYDEYGPGMASLEGQFGSGKASGIAALAGETTGTSQVQSPRAGGITAIEEPEIPTADNALALRSQQNVPAGTSVGPSGSGTAPSGTAPTAPQEFDLQTALEKVDPVEYTPVNRKNTDAVGIDRLKRFGMDPDSLKSPEDVGKEAYDTAAEQLGITVSEEDAKKGVLTKDAERRKGLEALAAIDKAQTDPDMLRRERLKAFLLGGAGRGSTALAGAGAASARLGAKQRRDIRARQVERNNMVKEIQDANTTLIQSAQARGDTATTRQANIINNAMQSLAQYDEAELAARRTDATNKMSASIANYERKMSEIELLAEQAQNRIQARIDRGDALRDVQNDARDQLEAVSEQFSTLQDEAIRSDAGVMKVDKEIAQELSRSNPDQKRLQDLRERRVVEIERVRDEFVIAHPRLHDLRQSLVDTINQLGSQIQSTLGVGSGVSAQQVDDAVQRQLQKGTPPYLQPYNP